MLFEFNNRINNVAFEVKFEDKVNWIQGLSGTGKTFLFESLFNYYLEDEEKKVTYIDYKIKDTKIIVAMCQDSDIVFLDNADLYLTSELLEEIRNSCKMVVVSKKHWINLGLDGVHKYKIKFEEQKLEVVRS